MERRQLEYFLAVADSGSFTGAALLLHVAQPSLSQAVKALEKEVGTPLFRRLPRGVAPTPAGDALLAPARQVVRDLRTARAAVQNVVGLRGGTLDLAMLPALTLDPLSTMIGRFRREHPSVHLYLAQPEQATEVHELVRSGEVEIGFMDELPIAGDDMVSEVVSTQPLWAAFPPGTELGAEHDVGWAELVAHGLICGGRGTLVRDLVDRWAAANGLGSPTPAIELGRRETGIYLVLAGAGVAAFPIAIARLAESLGAVVRPIENLPARTIISSRRAGPLSPAAAAFLSIVRSARGLAQEQ